MEKPHAKKKEHEIPEERVVCLAKSEKHTAEGKSLHILACGKEIRAYRFPEHVIHVITDPNHIYSVPTYSCLERRQTTPGMVTWVGRVPIYTTTELLAVNCPMCIESDHYELVAFNETEI